MNTHIAAPPTPRPRPRSPRSPRSRHRRAGGLVASLAVLVALPFTLGACSGSDAGGSEASMGSDPAADSAADSTGAGTESGAAGRSTASKDAPTAPSEADTGDSLVDSDGSVARPPATQRSIISTGTVSLISGDVATTRREVQRIADAQGGAITEDDTETDGDGAAAYARLVIRVPVDNFSDAMAALEKAADLRASNRSSNDVTTEVIDTDVRVRAQQASLKRVEALLARANTIRDIVWIEQQLTQRQSELDSLKSQQAYLADQTSESTITVDIERTPEKQSDDTDDDSGFLAGLGGGWDALKGFGTGLATVIGALLPFAVVFALVGMPVWLLGRRLTRRRRSAAPAAPAAQS